MILDVFLVFGLEFADLTAVLLHVFLEIVLEGSDIP